MQIKTINLILRKKIEDWLSTINDEYLVRDLRKHVVVTGGSIVSLLLGEPVNDYDIYIQSRLTLVRLVRYYIKNYDFKLLLGEEKSKYIQEEGGAEGDNSYHIAIRNLHSTQVKLFFDGAAGYKCDIPEGNEKKYIPAFFSPNAISLTDDIQIVIRFWGTPDKIHETYDFVHATNYFTLNDGLVTNKEALESILTKQLKYKGSLYPVTSVIRIQKFIKRKWNITAGETLKIIFQCSLLDLQNPDVLEEQLIGVDIAYFSALIEALRNVNKDKIDFTYLGTLIDKIFNGSEEIV